MAQHRHYSGDPRDWEAKLDRVMTRMKAAPYSWNYDRTSARRTVAASVRGARVTAV